LAAAWSFVTFMKLLLWPGWHRLDITMLLGWLS